MITLDLLKPGEKGKIDKIDIEMIPLKLIEMGCLPGRNVSLIQKAPFNDPIYLKIEETHLAIREETAKYIYVDIIK